MRDHAGQPSVYLARHYRWFDQASRLLRVFSCDRFYWAMSAGYLVSLTLVMEAMRAMKVMQAMKMVKVVKVVKARHQSPPLDSRCRHFLDPLAKFLHVAHSSAEYSDS
jgi:hypothetical protein